MDRDNSVQGMGIQKKGTESKGKGSHETFFQLRRQSKKANEQSENGKGWKSGEGWAVPQGTDPSQGNKWDPGQKGSERRIKGREKDKYVLRH